MRATFATIALTALVVAGCKPAEPLPPSESAVALDRAIDWSAAKLIAVQDAGRHKTLDSFAREAMAAMTGREHLPALSPAASLFEWLFNRDAYTRTPVIYIKEQGVRYHFSAHIRDDVVRRRINDTGRMSLVELQDRTVQRLIEELEPRATMVSAMRRVRNAQAVAQALDRMARLVPHPAGGPEDRWYTMNELLANLPADAWRSMGYDPASARAAFGEPIPGISESQALSAVLPWVTLREAWLKRDAAAVQQQLARLSDALPKLAAAGVYPDLRQRSAEARYYAMNKMTFGWVVYLIGTIASLYALVTRFRFPWWIAMFLLAAGLILHTYGIALRWQIVGRVPAANMFEAITFSAWIGVGMAFVLEIIFRSRVFALSGNAAGFFALIVAGFVVPGGGTITTIMGILDDIMLRIHTVLIIASYALIFIASVIALVYLFGYYVRVAPWPSMKSGFISMVVGLWMLAVMPYVFNGIDSESNLKIMQGWPSDARPWMGALGALLLGAACAGPKIGVRGSGIIAVVLIALMLVVFSLGHYGFAHGMAWVFTVVGLAWGLLTGWGIASAQRAATGGPALAGATVGFGAGEMTSGGAFEPGAAFRKVADEDRQRWILAGAAPGDERRSDLPAWLHVIDWSHLIILNIVVVTLFVGTILGAVWADYSWGRPWGWDPKEVFALNTWIIYAILVHVRFVVAERGLWTAWLSVAGCLMMAFNWCFVNFYIQGLHSYA